MNRYFGCNFKQLVNRYRIEYARRLLEGNECPVRELYSLCGFASRSVFYVSFNRILGTSPTVTDNMLVKIDPVNATFSADMLSLMNGKGQNLKVGDNLLAIYEAGEDEGDKSTARVEEINVDYIHNGKAYASTVKYNYGNIQYIPEGHGTEKTGDYKVTWSTSFSTKFNCWPVDCQYQWYETPVVYYREENVIKGSITKDKDGKVTAFTNVIKAISPYKGTVDPFDADDKDWTDWAEAFNTGDKQNVVITLITNNNGKEVKNEYFTAKFEVVDEGGIKKNAMVLTPTGAEVQVGGDVETSVVLTIEDKFGHTHDIPALKFTMKINHE